VGIAGGGAAEEGGVAPVGTTGMAGLEAAGIGFGPVAVITGEVTPDVVTAGVVATGDRDSGARDSKSGIVEATRSEEADGSGATDAPGV
jgi:hypothetical protein